MGIRFRCPNGHKIHVKTYLAGKRGICPECGLKVPIPPQSDPEFADKPRKKRSVQAHPQPGLPSGSASRSAGATSTRPEMGPTAQVPSPLPSANAASPPAGNAPALAGPTVTPGGPRAETAPDPIASAPHAKWFVRPPTGGQFGPAPGHVLREWIAEGRVTADSYVWREGWPEWNLAHEAFGTLGTTEGAEPIPAIVTQAAPRSTGELYRRRKSTRMTFTVVGLLGLACAVLFAVLVYVVRFMK